MNIIQATAIIERDKKDFDPFQALMTDDYMPEYTAACNFMHEYRLAWDDAIKENKRRNLYRLLYPNKTGVTK